jgi:hypothetical protein
MSKPEEDDDDLAIEELRHAEMKQTQGCAGAHWLAKDK